MATGAKSGTENESGPVNKSGPVNESGTVKSDDGKLAAVKSRAAKAGSAAKRTAGKAGDAVRTVAGKAETAIKDRKGISSDPMTNLIIADVALRGGGRIVRHLVERTLLGVKHSPDKARKRIKGRSMAQSLVGTAVARIATRSVPGALVIGGGLLAKALYDHNRRGKAGAEGEKAVDEPADGADT